MRRPLVLVACLGVLVAGPVGAGTTAPEPAQGIDVRPDPASTRKSEAGTLAELGSVSPGHPVRDAVLVRSSFDEPRDVLLYAADAQPAQGGGFGFSTRDDEQEQVGHWLDLERERVTVPADGQVLVPYTLTVPAGTEGGEYVGAVVAEPVDEGAPVGVQTRTRFAMAIYLRVLGGVPGSTPGRGDPGGTIVVEGVEPRFDGSKACPVVRYRNESQDVVDPVVTVTTDGPLGGASYRRERVGALLPDTSAEVALPCLDRPLGVGRLEVELTSRRGASRERSDYTWLPWPFLVSLLLLLIVLAALVTTFLRGVLKRTNPPEPDGDGAERGPD